MTDLRLEYLSFHPIKIDKAKSSLIGFVSFKIGKEYSYYELGVHTLKQAKENIKIRLVYPEKQTPNKELQQFIDEEVNAYILANYKEFVK